MGIIRSDLTWKSPKPDDSEVTVPLKDAAPGPVKIAIYEYGHGEARQARDGRL